MTDVHCPRCETKAALAGGKPYCQSCGWNIDAAEQLTRETLKSLKLMLGIAAFAIVSMLIAKAIGANFEFGGLWFVLAIGGLSLVYATLKEWNALRQIQTIRKRINVGAVGPLSGQSASERHTSSLRRDNYLLTLARPRRVRLSHQGKLDVGGAFLFSFLFVSIGLLFANDALQKHGEWSSWLFDLLWVAGILIFGIALAAQLGKEVGRRRLLRDGEVTLGRIIRQQWTGSKQPKSQITYSYQGKEGITHSGSDIDRTQTLYEEMTVAVFFDRDHPEDHAVEGVTVWEVKPLATGF